MNLDELVDSIPSEDISVKEDLVKWINDWKSNEKTVNDLSSLIDKWHGDVWFNSQDAQNKFYIDLGVFKKYAIDGIGGMTMNERLYWFGLFDKFDLCEDDVSKLVIYKKLLATP